MNSGSPRVGVIGVPDAWSSNALADAVEARTGYRLLVDMAEVVTDLEHGQVLAGGVDLCALDGLIVKKVGAAYGPHLLDRLEVLRFVAAAGVPIFSSPDSMMRLVDRLSCTVDLRREGIAMPATVVTESVEAAVATVRRFGCAVLKGLYSTKARGMLVLDAAGEDDGIVERVRAFHRSHPMMYIQQRINMPDRDLGVAFLGGEYLATYARVRGGDAWNTTILSGGHYEAHEPCAEVVEVARRAQAPFGLDFTCVDVVESADGPLVFEVSAFGGFHGLREGPGVDAAGLYADYVLEKVNGRK